VKRAWGIFLLVILVIGGISVYFVSQYKQGDSIAKNSTFKNSTFNNYHEEARPFYGDEGKLGKMNVLLLGVDSRREKRARADSIMIAHYDEVTHEAKLVSIMRDTYVKIPGHGKQKINAAYAYGGTELLRKTIKDNFDIDINYYAIVDFDGFSKVVDIIAPDGIKVDVPYRMSHGLGMTIDPGEQKLHGEKLIGYVRFRHDRFSDFGRVERQQEVLSKLKDEAMDIRSVFKLPKIIGVINPYMDTNMDTTTLLLLGKDLLAHKTNGIKTMRIPIKGSFKNKRFNHVGAVLDIDLSKNKSELKQFLSQTVSADSKGILENALEG
jgi:LCP family protein required for cell wall assembly